MKGIKDLQKLISNIESFVENQTVDIMKNQGRAMSSEANTLAPDDVEVTSADLPNGVILRAKGENAAYLEFGTGQYVFKRYEPTDSDDMAGYKDFAMNFYKTGKGRLRQKPYLFPAFFKGRDEYIKHLIQELKKL